MSRLNRNLTDTVAEFVCTTTYEEVPEHVLLETKRLLVDTIGCAIGGLTTESGRVALRYAEDLADAGNCSIVGRDSGRSPKTAAHVNARLANILDADDTFPNSAHLGGTSIFTALALAEHLGKTGRDLLTAIAVGYEVGARIGSWLGPPFQIGPDGLTVWNARGGPSASMTWGAVAGGASAAGLSLDQTRQAMAIAGANTPQPTIRKWADSPVQSMYKYGDGGWCAEVGTSAVLLARQGSTGLENILDGPNAFWEVYGSPVHNDDALVEGLGNRWEILNAAYKPWPSCRWAHYPLTAFVDLMQEHDLHADEIDRVVVRACPLGISPIFQEQQPADPLTAQFSHAYGIAAAAYGVPPGPAWYSETTMADPVLRNMRSRISVELEPTAADLGALIVDGQWREVPGGVDIYARDEVFSKTVGFALGDPWCSSTKMTDRGLEVKFAGMVESGRSPERDGVSPSVLGIVQLADRGSASELGALIRAMSTPPISV